MLQMLIVDDELEEREGILFLLQKYQFDISTTQAPNGKIALEYLQEHPVDILFTDVRMPFIDGLTLAKEALTIQPEIRIILFSGFSEFEYAKTAMSLGVREYILKPVNVQEFCTVIRRVCEDVLSRRMEKERDSQRLAYAREHLLYSLVNGIPLHTLMADAGALFDLSFLSQYTNMLLLEFNRDFFEHAGIGIVEELKQQLTIPFDYLNLNPCQSLLFFPHAAGRTDWPSFAADLRRAIRRRYQEDCYLAYSEDFSEPSAIPTIFESLEQAMEKRFFLPNTYIFSTSVASPRSEAFLQDESTLFESIEQALQEHHLDVVRQNIHTLCEKYAGQTNFSHLYVKFLFSNLLRDISLSWAHFPEEVLFKKVEAIYRSNSYHEIENILDKSLDESPQSFPTSSNYVETVKRYISKHYDQEINLESLAEIVYLSPRYLSSIFKKETGCGLNKYLKAFRMEKARDLLEHTHMKVVAICDAVGYTNVSYFIQSFREYFGSSPEKFRQKED